MSQKPAKRKSVTSASTADRHELYEIAVQAVDAEIDMVDDTFTSIRGRKASLLREDFCGTANSSCEWVRRRSTNFSVGLDLSQEVLDWGMSNNISGLDPDQQQQIDLINQDVNHYSGPPAEIIVAMNFSYQLFKTRDELRCYFENARDGLTEDGVFFIDAYGG